MNKITAFYRKYTLLLNLALFVIIIGVIIPLLLSTSSKQNSILTGGPTATPIPVKQADNSPNVYFNSYLNKSSLPTIPNSINIYNLKNNFSEAESMMFAAKLGITSKPTSSSKSDSDSFVDVQNHSLLSFNKATGSFSFQSSGNFKPRGYHAGLDVRDESIALLNQLDNNDGTITCSITYQKKSAPDITFVECHRDWQKVTLPIFNFVGLLNVPFSTSLSSLQLGKATAISYPDDPDITSLTGAVSDGKARPTDFNSTTVEINKDGAVVSVNSNLRWITNTQVLESKTNLLTPQEALKEFLNHNSIYSLTQPSGNGQINLQKVYQNNRAYGQQATITDYVLSYVEKDPSEIQQYLVPMYTIRGYATLESGYSVSFVETIPALKDQRSFLSLNSSQNLDKSGISFNSVLNIISNTLSGFFSKQNAFADNKQLQLGTFNPLTPAVSPTGSVTITPGQTMNKCFDYSSLIFADKSKNRNLQHGILNLDQGTFPVAGSGNITLAYNLAYAAGAAGGFASDMVFYESSTFPATISQAADDFFGLVANQYAINVARHLATDQAGKLNASSTVTDVKNLFSTINGGQCSSTPPVSNAAPSYNCSSTNSPRGTLDTARMNSVADSTAQQILSAVKANTINSLAGQADLVPASFTSRYTFVNGGFFGAASSDPNLSALGKCYLTGGVTLVEGASPSLFIYPEEKISVNILLPSFTTYSSPPTYNNSWTITANPNGLLSDNIAEYTSLYYEYNKNRISFLQPDTGYITPYDNWENTINNIAAKLGLTQNEHFRLISEVKNALFGMPLKPFLKLSLVNQEELNQKLQLNIYPKPDSLNRIQVLINPLDESYSITNPIINPIKRSGLSVVEIGAREN